MKETLIVFLFVIIVATAGIALIEEEYNFPTGDAILRRCKDHTECNTWEYCENVNGGSGDIDGRRGKQCRIKFPAGINCFENIHCRTNYCDPQTKVCAQIHNV